MIPSRSTCVAIAFVGLSLGITFPFGAARACLAIACTVFPADAGIVNVKDFGAKGDGMHDDTVAILTAIRSPLAGEPPPTIARALYNAPIIYFPKGVYLVSDTLSKRYPDGRDANRMVLMGESKEETTIRLLDSAPGYANRKAPKAIISTSSALFDGTATSGGKDYHGKGEGNDAYLNYVENITVYAGRHNPGAIGIDYLANNVGAVRNVVIRSEDREGAVGISLLRKWIGPALLKDIVVEGFDTGIDVGNSTYTVTMEGIHLAHQKFVALRNDGNALAIRHLTVDGGGETIAILNASSNGLIVIDQASLNSPPVDIDAITNRGYLNLRQVKVKGYSRVLGQGTPHLFIDGVYASNDRVSASRAGWSLMEQDPESLIPDDPRQWVSVTAHGARADGSGDSSAAIQAAFNSGASTIYFPHGVYSVESGVDIPPSVKQVEGMMSVIKLTLPRKLGFTGNMGLLRVHNDKAPLLIEKLLIDAADTGEQVGIEVLGHRTLALRDMWVLGAHTIRPATAGPMFLENIALGGMQISGSQPVWAWQLNSEGKGTRITNTGSPLWVLGIKTEGDCTVVENVGGATTEILGGLLYPVRRFSDPTTPAFVNHDGRLLASYAEAAFVPGSSYGVHLVSTMHGVEIRVSATSLPPRRLRPDAGARVVPRLITGE